MKTCKSLFALLLALALAAGLCACSMSPPPDEEEPVITAKTPLPQDDEARLAYFGQLVAIIAADAKKCAVETTYGIGDIEAENGTLKAAANTLKNSITDWLANKKEFELPDEAFFLEVPAAADVTEILVRDVLEMEIQRRLEELQVAIDEGRNTTMGDAGEPERRDYVIEQMGVSAKRDNDRFYQINITLEPAATESLVQPGDKEAVLAELAKSGEYLLVEDYALAPKELTIYVRVLKETDRVTEITITEKADLTTTVKGVGSLAGEGEFPLTLTLTKNVKYNGFVWPETPEED